MKRRIQNVILFLAVSLVSFTAGMWAASIFIGDWITK